MAHHEQRRAQQSDRITKRTLDAAPSGHSGTARPHLPRHAVRTNRTAAPVKFPPAQEEVTRTYHSHSTALWSLWAGLPPRTCPRKTSSMGPLDTLMLQTPTRDRANGASRSPHKPYVAEPIAHRTGAPSPRSAPVKNDGLDLGQVARPASVRCGKRRKMVPTAFSRGCLRACPWLSAAFESSWPSRSLMATRVHLSSTDNPDTAPSKACRTPDTQPTRPLLHLDNLMQVRNDRLRRQVIPQTQFGHDVGRCLLAVPPRSLTARSSRVPSILGCPILTTPSIRFAGLPLTSPYSMHTPWHRAIVPRHPRDSAATLVTATKSPYYNIIKSPLAPSPLTPKGEQSTNEHAKRKH